jgi:hypothetical protein
MEIRMTACRNLCLALLCLFQAGCVALHSTTPGDPDTLGFWTIFDYASEAKQVHGLIADLPRLVALNVDAARREQAAASAQFAADDSEANRLRLAWLMSLDIGGRNDVSLLALLDDANAPPSPPSSPLRQFRLMLRRYTLERIRGQRDALARGDTHQRETDAKLRDTETRLREAQTRADDLQQKLDALIELERSLNKRSSKPRKEAP